MKYYKNGLVGSLTNSPLRDMRLPDPLMSKRFVIGDIHGCHRALQQVFKRAEFRPDTDELISLGDVVDGWPMVHAGSRP